MLNRVCDMHIGEKKVLNLNRVQVGTLTIYSGLGVGESAEYQ